MMHSRSGETDLECAGGGRIVKLNSDVIGCAGCHRVGYFEIVAVTAVVIGCQRRLS